MVTITPLKIEDYGLIGDGRSCALVGRNGSIDWLCWPRFDSPACFAALLGDGENGHWQLAPDEERGGTPITVTRSYRNHGMVLETVFETHTGVVAVLDFMAVGAAEPTLIRIVEGRRGAVPVLNWLVLRFDYGLSVPWVTRLPDNMGISAIAGPSRCVLRCPVALHGEDRHTVSRFIVSEGDQVPFVLTYMDSHGALSQPIDAQAALHRTEQFWADWIGRCTYQGEHASIVRRSLLTLKALIYQPTGGIVAAPTTSLPEELGGGRNWDYRYCWLRDASLTLIAIMAGGYFEEAMAWRDWLQAAVAGSPDQVQIMYGIAGERLLNEWEAGWLAGYEGSQPVRVGNAAAGQLQLDVYGEAIAALHVARQTRLCAITDGWRLQVGLLQHLATIWKEPDEGMWEVRGGRRQFTVSKISCWLAFDRAIRDVEKYGLEAPLEEWKALRQDIHDTVCREGFNADKNSFVQYFGGTGLDAGLLLIPVVGFLPADDPRVSGTVAAIERELLDEHGFVRRYLPDHVVEGVAGDEGAFIACSFWLVNAYVAQGRMEEAHALFNRLLALCSDLGLLAEEYDATTGRQVGNFPQAFSHLSLINSASILSAGRITTMGAAPLPVL